MADEPTKTTGTAGSPRIRLIIDTDDVIRRAVLRRVRRLSAKEDRDVTNSEIVTDILREALAKEIAELEHEDRRGKPTRR